MVYAVLVLLIINFKPSGLLGEWELTDLFRKKNKKRAADSEEVQ